MKNRPIRAFLAAFALFFLTEKAAAQTEAAAVRQLDSLEKSWVWQSGKIHFAEGEFSISTPSGLRFLAAEQSRFVLEKLWGNAPDASTLGLFFEAKSSPLDSSVWAVEVGFDEIGRVGQTDLENFEPDFLLKSLQNDQKTLNEARKSEGLAAVEIVGWAAAPRLGAGRLSLFWAKKLRVEGDSGPERVSSEARILGRRGCARLNALGSMDEFGAIQKVVESLAAATEFDEKTWDSGDKRSAWSFAGLVAGRAFSSRPFLSDFWKMALAGLAFLSLFWFLKKGKKA